MFLRIFYVLCFCSLLAVQARDFRHPRDHFTRNSDHGRFQLKREKGECRSDMLTCVSKHDCELDCPYGFKKLEEGGACYYFSEMFSQPRTFLDAQDFCDDLGSRLLWIEDATEMKNLINLHVELFENSTMDVTTIPTTDSPSTATTDGMPPTTEMPQAGNEVFHHIAAEYDKYIGAWTWKGTGDEIDWNIILFDIPNAKETLNAIDNANINKCLLLALPKAFPASGSLIRESSCIEPQRFVCKLGEARVRCAETSATQCCFSPSYDFFYLNKDEQIYAKLDHRPGGCQLRLPTGLVKCKDVLPQIHQLYNETSNMYAVARVDSSYYYIASHSDECIGEEAVVSSEDVHDFLTSVMATRELLYQDKNIKIGLTFQLDKQKAIWVNGKPSDYYPQFWSPGEPRRDESVDGGCAAYSNIPNTATFLWKLFSKEMCDTFDKVCELPLAKTTHELPTPQQTCGKRHERGVLAKSIHSIYTTDEANFGEFPWQAAVMYPEKYGREVRRKFACSGALVHKNFVLTSAHCITSTNSDDFVVVLGQNDLTDEESILEPITIDVQEVIFHNDFNFQESFLYDIALLKLDGEIDVDAHPHIGLGCLPDPDEIRSHGGDWECYVTGWSSNHKHHRSLTLTRLETDFTSSEYCRRMNRDYYEALAYSKRHYGGRYENEYNRYSYRSQDAELLCTKTESPKCLVDPSPILICKKEDIYVKRPFFEKRPFDREHSYETQKKRKHEARKTSKAEYSGPKNKEIKTKLSKPTRYDYEDEYIINTFELNRFGNDKWYVVGIGNTLSQCAATNDRQRYPNRYRYDRFDPKENQPSAPKPFHKDHKSYSFTSVYDYIDFIYFILDLQ